MKVSSKWYYHFRCVLPDMPNLPKIKSVLFPCNILRKNWMMKLRFCMHVSMKTYYKLILWFWWRWWSIFKVPKIASLQSLYNISKNKLDVVLIFCMQIKKFPTSWFQHFGQHFDFYKLILTFFLISTLWATLWFLQVDINVFNWNGQPCLKYPK